MDPKIEKGTPLDSRIPMTLLKDGEGFLNAKLNILGTLRPDLNIALFGRGEVLWKTFANKLLISKFKGSFLHCQIVLLQEY